MENNAPKTLEVPKEDIPYTLSDTVDSNTTISVSTLPKRKEGRKLWRTVQKVRDVAGKTVKYTKTGAKVVLACATLGLGTYVWNRFHESPEEIEKKANDRKEEIQQYYEGKPIQKKVAEIANGLTKDVLQGKSALPESEEQAEKDAERIKEDIHKHYYPEDENAGGTEVQTEGGQNGEPDPKTPDKKEDTKGLREKIADFGSDIGKEIRWKAAEWRKNRTQR